MVKKEFGVISDPVISRIIMPILLFSVQAYIRASTIKSRKFAIYPKSFTNDDVDIHSSSTRNCGFKYQIIKSKP